MAMPGCVGVGTSTSYPLLQTSSILQILARSEPPLEPLLLLLQLPLMGWVLVLKTLKSVLQCISHKYPFLQHTPAAEYQCWCLVVLPLTPQSTPKLSTLLRCNTLHSHFIPSYCSEYWPPASTGATIH